MISFKGDVLKFDVLLRAAPPVEKEFTTLDAPPLPELDPAELARAVKAFETYCQETMDRGTMVAARARCYALPPAEAVRVIEEIYAPRCAALDPPQPWSRENIIHKLEQTYSGKLHADFIFGPGAPRLPPEGFFERLRAGKPIETTVNEEGVEVESNCARGNGGAEKISMTDLVADLRTHASWENVLQFNDLQKTVTASKNSPIKLDAQKTYISDADFIRIQLWFERHGKRATKEQVIDAVHVVARENVYHPILDYLASIPSVNHPHDPNLPFHQIAKRCFGNASPLAQDVIAKTLIAAVRRVRKPGTKVDTMLVLRGDQGKKKSTLLSILFGEKYTKSQMPDLSNKEASLGLLGFWCVEFAELDRIIRTESSTAKEFISRPFDDCRRPWGRADERFARQVIFIGTTNDEEFLIDATGNRRYWVIEIYACDLEWLRENRDSIWATAAALEAEDVPHWFEDETQAEPLQKPYEVVDGWEHAIREYCTGREFTGTATEIYLEIIAKGDTAALAKLDKRGINRIGSILKKFRCKPRKSNGKCRWEIPEPLRSEPLSPEEAKRRATAESIKKLSKN
jgi:hypothetical protein